MNTIASSTPAKEATITDLYECQHAPRFRCFSRIYTQLECYTENKPAVMKLVKGSYQKCFDVLIMYRNFTKWSSSRKYEAPSTTVVPRFTPMELEVVIPGSIVLWQEVAPHTWKQVLPPVSQLKLITLSEKAWVTCSRSRFNLIVISWLYCLFRSPWKTLGPMH